MKPEAIQDARARLADIHAQVARGAHFQGYRAAPVAAMGALAFAAAALEPLALARGAGLVAGGAPLDAAQLHAGYWAGVAVLAAGLAAVDLVRRYGLLPRRTTALALGQFAPACAVGATLLGALWDHASLLPGLWTMVFGLGVLASAAYLPRAVNAVALFYVAAGIGLTLAAEAGAAPSPWAMGLTFGVGQLASAAALHRGATVAEERPR